MNGGLSVWAVSPEERDKHDQKFDTLYPSMGYVSGEQARKFFLQSGLPSSVLAEIWALADMNKDGKMDRLEFSIAMKLIKLKLQGTPLPSVLPIIMKQPPVSAPNLSSPELNYGMGPVANMSLMSGKNLLTPITMATPGLAPMIPPAAGLSPLIGSTPIRPLMTTLPNGTMGLLQPVPAGALAAGLPLSVSPYTSPLVSSSALPPTSVTSQMAASRGDWGVPHATRLKYRQQFNGLDTLMTGYLTGQQVRSAMANTMLSQTQLASIWNLADVDKDGKLTAEEFILAMHLVDVAKSGQPLPPTLPTDLIPPTQRASVNGSSTPLYASLADDLYLEPPQKARINMTFEDKFKANLERGNAELEKRRLALQEAERKEQEKQAQKAREEQELREKEAREAEERRRKEEERRLERQRELERQKEEERLRELERKEAAQRELERQRKEEWEKRKRGELQIKRRQEQDDIIQLKAKKRSLEMQLEAVGNKHRQISDRLRDIQNKKKLPKTELDLINQRKDARQQDIKNLQKQIEEFQRKLSHLTPEQKRLTEKLHSMAQNMSVSAMSTLKLSVTEKKGTCIKLKGQLDALEKETTAKLKELDRYNKDMQELKESQQNQQTALEKLRSLKEDKKHELTQRKQEEEERRKREEERKRQEEDRRRKEEEAQRRIEIEKERQRQEKLRRDEEERQKRLQEEQEAKKKEEEEKAKQALIQAAKLEAERELRAKEEAVRKRREEEERKKREEEEWQRQAERRRQEEERKKLEEERRQLEEERRKLEEDRRQEEKRRKEDEERLKREEERRRVEEERRRERERQEEERRRQREEEERRRQRAAEAAIRDAEERKRQEEEDRKRREQQHQEEERRRREEDRRNLQQKLQEDDRRRREEERKRAEEDRKRKVEEEEKRKAEEEEEKKRKEQRPPSGGGKIDIQEKLNSLLRGLEERKGRQPRPLQQRKSVSLTPFRALYPFTARNHEELTFNADDIIEVDETAGPEEGWLYGSRQGQLGWFPKSYVERVAASDSAVAVTPPKLPIQSELSNVLEAAKAGATKSAFTPTHSPKPGPSDTQGQKVVGNLQAQALCSWTAKTDNHLNFNKADVIQVLEKQENWWLGELNGEQGWFPKSYVTLLGEEESSDIKSSTSNALDQSDSQQLEEYVALYTYESPEHADLTFREGDVILVIKKDGEWWNGTTGNRAGVFPSNYVKPKEADTTSTSGKKPEIAKVTRAHFSSGPGQLNLENGQLIVILSKNTSDWWLGELQARGKKRQKGWFPPSHVQILGSSVGKSTPAVQSVCQVIALYDYTAVNKDELSFSKNQLINILNKNDPHWWKGEVNGVTGLVPTNYVGDPSQQWQ